MTEVEVKRRAKHATKVAYQPLLHHARNRAREELEMIAGYLIKDFGLGAKDLSRYVGRHCTRWRR